MGIMPLNSYRRWLWPALLIAFMVLGACGRGREQTQATPTAAPPIAVAPAAAEAATEEAPLEILDNNLLTVPGATIQCDSSPDVAFACDEAGGVQTLDATIDASVYARWSLRLPPAAPPLTGTETLELHARRTGDLGPNLYLVDEAGVRVPVRLGRYGLGDEWGVVHVPLAEIKDDQGVAPDFSQLREIQIVFEWSDMAGQLAFDDLRFAPIWREDVTVGEQAGTLAAELSAPEGFVIDAVADDLQATTQIDFTPEGDMLVSLQNGRVWWYRDEDGDGRYDQRHLYDAGYTEIVGLLYDPTDGGVWLGGRGQLYHTLDTNGDGAADVRELRIDGLPWGRHQNNGLAWNPDPDPFSGEPAYSWIYFGLGSTDDLEVGGPLNASVLRFPRGGQSADDLEIISQGNRNPYMVVWAPVPVNLDDPDGETAWQLFASENGPDFNDAPDEVNHIRKGLHYGFPEQFGPVAEEDADGDPYAGPVYAVTPHASASGLAYVSNPDWPPAYRTLYVTLFGQVFDEKIVGHTVERVTLSQVETPVGPTYRGEPSDFITGLDRPLPIAVSPHGDLFVGDYATGVIYRVRYQPAE